MKRLLVFVLIMSAIAAVAQTSASSAKSPKEVVQEYWRTETEGGRLTPEGWYRAGSFYVHPIPPPKEKTILVVHSDSSVWNPLTKGNTAQVIVGIRSAGKIDSALRYTPPDTRAVKEGALYNLVLADKHWELEPDAKSGKEVTGPPEWRISDAPGAAVYLSVDTAIRYVEQVRDKSHDPVLKKNANKTLAILKHYH